MADTILVVVEQKDGKLNRVSWETLTGAQALAAEAGWGLEVAVVGSGVGHVANEVAANQAVAPGVFRFMWPDAVASFLFEQFADPR